MVKHTQAIRQQIADELLSVFDHFVGLALKGLNKCWIGKDVLHVLRSRFWNRLYKNLQQESLGCNIVKEYGHQWTP